MSILTILAIIGLCILVYIVLGFIYFGIGVLILMRWEGALHGYDELGVIVLWPIFWWLKRKEGRES